MDEDDLFDVLERTDFDQITAEAITDCDELLTELDTIEQRGYAFNDQENLDGLHAVGVPISGPQGEVIGPLSVSGPSHRLKGERFEEKLPNMLLGAADELELDVAHG